VVQQVRNLEVSEAPEAIEEGLDAFWGSGVSWELWIPVFLLAAILVACFVLPLIVSLRPPNATNFTEVLKPPGTPGYLFGTDDLGRDLLSRVLYGGQISLEIGIGAAALGMLVGGSMGILGSFIGGYLDIIVMRVLDILLAFPSLVLALVVAAYLGPSESHLIFAISFFTVPAFGRFARAGTLRVREANFVMSARLSGISQVRSLWRNIVPNVAPDVMSYGLLIVGVSMIVEASLDYLGLGVKPPTATWGTIISAGVAYLNGSPYLVLIPGGFLFVTVICVNMIGDALRKRVEFGINNS